MYKLIVLFCYVGYVFNCYKWRGKPIKEKIILFLLFLPLQYQFYCLYLLLYQLLYTSMTYLSFNTEMSLKCLICRCASFILLYDYRWYFSYWSSTLFFIGSNIYFSYCSSNSLFIVGGIFILLYLLVFSYSVLLTLLLEEGKPVKKKIYLFLFYRLVTFCNLF